MKITRNGVEYELTKQELFEASEAYAHEQAKDIVTERASTEIDSHVAENVIDAGVDAYLDAKDNGYDEDCCLNEAMNAARQAHAVNLGHTWPRNPNRE